MRDDGLAEPGSLLPSEEATPGVSELLERLRGDLAQIGRVRVQGEIGRVYRSPAGHFYFDLKDESAQLRSVLFRRAASDSDLEPVEGAHVRLEGRFDVYAERGALQLVVERIAPVGEGALRLAFERLLVRLREEGLFDDAHKQPLPILPRRIGVVTSLGGAAVHDFLETLGLRFPGADVLLCDARVQGDGAWREVVRALHLLDAVAEVDVIVLTRGGGSLEDLWTFNREEVARAIFELTTPVVSAIGHEVDVVLTDHVADRRAATPTAAAALVVPDAGELRARVAGLADRLRHAQTRKLTELEHRLEALRRGVVHPASRIDALAAQIAQARLRLGAASARTHERAQQRLASASGKLDALSPLAVLGRGYGLVRRGADGAILRSSADTAPGEDIHVRLARGSLSATVVQREDP